MFKNLQHHRIVMSVLCKIVIEIRNIFTITDFYKCFSYMRAYFIYDEYSPCGFSYQI